MSKTKIGLQKLTFKFGIDNQHISEFSTHCFLHMSNFDKNAPETGFSDHEIKFIFFLCEGRSIWLAHVKF